MKRCWTKYILAATASVSFAAGAALAPLPAKADGPPTIKVACMWLPDYSGVICVLTS